MTQDSAMAIPTSMVSMILPWASGFLPTALEPPLAAFPIPIPEPMAPRPTPRMARAGRSRRRWLSCRRSYRRSRLHSPARKRREEEDAKTIIPMEMPFKTFSFFSPFLGFPAVDPSRPSGRRACLRRALSIHSKRNCQEIFPVLCRDDGKTRGWSKNGLRVEHGYVYEQEEAAPCRADPGESPPGEEAFPVSGGTGGSCGRGDPLRDRGVEAGGNRPKIRGGPDAPGGGVRGETQ